MFDGCASRAGDDDAKTNKYWVSFKNEHADEIRGMLCWLFPGTAAWAELEDALTLTAKEDVHDQKLKDKRVDVEKDLHKAAMKLLKAVNTHPEDFLPAFVAGRVSGRDLPDETLPFVVTANQIILASGMTWKRDANWFYYTLLQPKWVAGPEFSPQVALVVGAECWAGKESP